VQVLLSSRRRHPNETRALRLIRTSKERIYLPLPVLFSPNSQVRTVETSMCLIRVIEAERKIAELFSHDRSVKERRNSRQTTEVGLNNGCSDIIITAHRAT
jgi:hypothetical protein